MHIRENLINYLKDEEYVICFYSNKVYIYKYKELKRFSDNIIIFNINKYLDIEIKGEDLSIQKITKEEVLIKGSIKIIEKNEVNE